MFYARKVFSRIEYREASPYMGTRWYNDGGWVAYAGARPKSRVSIEGGTIDERGIVRGGTLVELPAPPPPPRVLSKLKLHDQLSNLGLWDTLKAAIAADPDVSDRWTLAQDIREDDPDFVVLYRQLQDQLDQAGIDPDSLLDACVTEGTGIV